MQRLEVARVGNGFKSLEEVKKCEGAKILQAGELNPDNTRIIIPYCNETILLKLNLEM